MTEHRKKYSHIVRCFDGNAFYGHFSTEHEAMQSHAKFQKYSNVKSSIVQFSDFGGKDCSARILAEWRV